MFKYINDVSNIAHGVIKNYCTNFITALDATLGNYDTDFYLHYLILSMPLIFRNSVY